jgi:hypothetical protein
MHERQTQLLRDARAALAAAKPLPESRAFVGFDGFVDDVVHIVHERRSSTDYTPIATIADYARRLALAAGKSTNVEMVTLATKMGGNGPLMADALGRLGCGLRYVGIVGDRAVHPAFEPLVEHGEVIPIGAPAHTIAAEFEDGKIMHGRMDTLLALTPARLLDALGSMDALASRLRGCQLLGLVNWTMTPHATGLWQLVAEALATLAPGDRPRLAFFDLCDPQKRPMAQLLEALHVLAGYQDLEGVQPILGLNERESELACEALGLDPGSGEPEALVARAERIGRALRSIEVVIHPTRAAAAWSPEGGGSWTAGPHCARPLLTTGAGDHFNGGYCAGRLMGLPPRLALVAGKCVSGHYVRNARGPRAEELPGFIDRWLAGALDG